MGDLVLVRHRGPVATGIRLFERLRRPRRVDRAAWRRACAFNHAAIVVDGGPGAVISEEGFRGDVRAKLSAMDTVAYAVVHVEMTASQRGAAVAFARRAVGSSYGYLSIFADAFNALTGLELVCRWETGWSVPPRQPGHSSERVLSPTALLLRWRRRTWPPTSESGIRHQPPRKVAPMRAGPGQTVAAS